MSRVAGCLALIIRSMSSTGLADSQAVIRRIIQIQTITVAWMTVEAVCAFGAAWRALSPALLAFGGDSAIELLSAVVVFWRFSSKWGGEQTAFGSHSHGRTSLCVGGVRRPRRCTGAAQTSGSEAKPSWHYGIECGSGRNATAGEAEAALIRCECQRSLEGRCGGVLLVWLLVDHRARRPGSECLLGNYPG
jgi:hypothetical protein